MKEWVCGTIIVLALIGFPTACTMDQQRKIAEASARGEDPIAIKCAMDSVSSNNSSSAICIIKAATQKVAK